MPLARRRPTRASRKTRSADWLVRFDSRLPFSSAEVWRVSELFATFAADKTFARMLLYRAFQLIRTNAPKQPMALFPTRPEMCAQMQKSPSSSEKCSDLGRRYTKHASRQGREFPKRLYERTMLTGSRLQRNYMPSSLQPKLRHSPYECQRKAGVSH